MNENQFFLLHDGANPTASSFTQIALNFDAEMSVVDSGRACRCDRVLWHGEGLYQLDYTRDDSRLSDHRAVSATFTAEVEVVSRKKLKKACAYPVHHELDVRTKVVPMVKPLIDVRKLPSNEVWSSLL